MTVQQPVVEEVVVRLVEVDRLRFEWRCTPRDLEALVVGRLFAEGVIPDGEVAGRLRIERFPDQIVARLDERLSAERVMRSRLPQVAIPTAEQFTDLFRALFSTVDAHYQEGGMHAAALVRNGAIVYQAEDVGRHNAVDKAIGMAVIAGVDIAAHGMLVSSRVSGEIARKAAHSTIAWLASRSIPTTLAVKLARQDDMPIIGRAAGRNAIIYR